MRLEFAATNPQLMECLTSWLREVPPSDIVTSPLLDTITNALGSEASFDAAVDCLCAIFKETTDVDENMTNIQTLYPRVISLRPKIAAAAESEDLDTYKGITRLFSEAGEAWVVLIARHPVQFRDLVECILECALRDKDRDAISLTFNFWFEIRSYLTLERYIEARAAYADLFSKLVDIMVKHMEYPVPEDGNEADLFDGDREMEEKFRGFRHSMGDVLKDCCEVIGVTECLGKVTSLITQWVTTYGPQASDGKVPHWQELEAPLFSMRAMGRMVDKDENIVLPQVIPLIVQLPEHDKIRFATILVLGRYTEWTSEHPLFLQPQLNYIISAFEHGNPEVIRAAAMSLQFFCLDCKELLVDNLPQLQGFYENISARLPVASLEEVTKGVAAVVSVQPKDKIYEALKGCCTPILQRLMAKANAAKDEPSKLALAGKTLFKIYHVAQSF
jgi:transportin-3